MDVGGIQNNSTNLASSLSSLMKAAYYDPKDTNQDGIVSAAEELAYSAMHPEEDILQLSTGASAGSTSMATNTPLNQYSQKGAVNAEGTTAGSSLSLYA